MDERELKALIAGQVVCGLLSNDKLVSSDGGIAWADLVADAVEVANLIWQQSTAAK